MGNPPPLLSRHVFSRNAKDIFLVGVAKIALEFFVSLFFCGFCHLRDVSIISVAHLVPLCVGSSAAGSVAQIRFAFWQWPNSVKETSFS